MLNDTLSRQCRGKIKHQSQDEAKVAAKALHKRQKQRFNTYQCPFCTWWHVGAQRSQAAAMRRSERRGQLCVSI